MHPERIGPYLIDRKIGAGGMGNVYRGRHVDSGRYAAVKVLPASLAREDGFVQRFSREIHALKKLRSQHIVELFDDGSTEDGSWYYAMEYVDGETLTSFISRRQKIPWNEVSDIAAQIAIALKSAHDAGVIHRDIKPSNLMITADGTVKLTDFGVAHVFATTRLTRTGGVVGTAEYMSPEQARGQRATKRSDLYSLGAVMYAMLTGRPPFTGNTSNEILNKQQYAQVDRPSHYAPGIPRLFEDLVCQLLEKKPDQRIPDALVLSRRLEQIRARIAYAKRQLEDATAPASAGTTSERPDSGADTGTGDSEEEVQRPGAATMVRDMLREDVDLQRRRSPIARFFDHTAVLITLLALVLGLGYYLWQNSRPDPVARMEEAEQILSGEPRRSWLRARDDLLQPLLDDNHLPGRTDDIQQMIHRVDQYEFTRSLDVADPDSGSRDAEIQRLIRQAFREYADGDPLQARTQLASVGDLLSPADGFLQDFVKETLTRWEEDANNQGRRELVESVIQEAEQATPKSTGNSGIGDIQRRLSAAVSLYGNDPVLSDEVSRCRQLLDRLAQQ